MIINREFVMQAVRLGAVFYVSHSGGKDSQLMYGLIKAVVPADQIVVVHADLGKVEWEGVQDHIVDNIEHPLHVVRAGKTLFQMVEHRRRMRADVPSWPSSATRQCTSDLKRGPIYKFIRNHAKLHGVKYALNCTGLRADESSARSKKKAIQLNKTLSKAGRIVWDYLPIFAIKTSAVFLGIRLLGQKPFHAYSGNERLSCVFCIMGSDNDLRHGAQQRPELYQEYLALERKTGWTMFNGQSLRERVEGPDLPAAA